jgi:hypothetical protein
VAIVIVVAILVVAIGAVSLYSHALDVRDKRRRAERLAAWYVENEGRQTHEQHTDRSA